MTASPTEQELVIKVEDAIFAKMNEMAPDSDKKVSKANLDPQYLPYLRAIAEAAISVLPSDRDLAGASRKIGDQIERAGQRWECTAVDPERGNTWELISPEPKESDRAG